MKPILCALALSMPLPVLAQAVVGQSVVEGRKIEILDNNTWRYAEPGDTDCLAVTERVSFCGDQQVWEPVDLDNDKVAAGFRNDDRHYAQYIIEGIGTDDGLSPKVMREIVIENAANASGRPAATIPVLTVEPALIDDAPAETMVYVGDIDGFSFVFANTMYLTPDFSMQVISFAVAEEYSDKHAALHADLLAATRITQ